MEDNIVSFIPTLTQAELEMEFYVKINDILLEYQDRGMTPSWQRGCIDMVSLQLSSD